VPSFILVGALYFFMRHQEAAYYSPGGDSLFNYVITQPFVYLHYVTNFILPLHFSAEWDWTAFDSVLDARCIGGFVFLSALLWAMINSSKFERWRPVSFGIAWFLIALVPTTFVPLADVMNDHRVFFPYIGLALAFVWTIYLVLWPLIERVPRAALVIVLLGILSALGYSTYQRNKVWLTEETLFKEVTIECPTNGRGLMIYGLQFMNRGSFDTAISYYSRALKYVPYYPILYINLAIARSGLGDLAGAEENFLKAIELGPNDPDVYYYYGRFLYQHGRNDEAIVNMYKTISMAESRLDARHDLMQLLFQQRRADELKTVASRTLEISAGDADATRYLGLIAGGNIPPQAVPTTPEGFIDLSLEYYQAGNYQKSLEAAQSALKLKPDNAKAWNNICCAYNMMGRFAEGKAAAEQALRLEPDFQLAKNNLDWSIQELNKK
jgi:tetratricopeptide (TPR) repeat protein